MTDTIKSINNHHEGDYISKLIKTSPSLTHLTKFPILKESFQFLTGFYLFSYIATLISKLILDLKESVLDKYFKFAVEWIEYFDKLNDIYILGNVDQYLPLLTKIHLKDLYPSNIYSTTIDTSKNYYQFSIAKANEFKDNKVKPTIISKTNPIVAPVNTKFQSLIDTYLPSKAESEPIFSTTSSSEVSKFFNLLTISYQRVKPLILGKYQNVKQYPSKIQSIYNDELNKNDKNVTKALANTSIEISNKTLSTIGLSNGKVNTPNGASNGVVPNGEISVGA